MVELRQPHLGALLLQLRRHHRHGLAFHSPETNLPILPFQKWVVLNFANSSGQGALPASPILSSGDREV